jgi:hypothetical protein
MLCMSTDSSVDRTIHCRHSVTVDRTIHCRHSVTVDRTIHCRRSVTVDHTIHCRRSFTVDRTIHCRRSVTVDRTIHCRSSVTVDRTIHCRHSVTVDSTIHFRCSVAVDCTARQYWYCGGTFSPWQVTSASERPALLCAWSWRLQGCPKVSYYLPCWMGHILRTAVLCSSGENVCSAYSSQKAVDCCRMEQGSWKADICSPSQEIAALMEHELSFLNWRMAATESHCDTATCVLFWCKVVRCKCYCCRRGRFSFYVVTKLFWLG